MGVPPYAPPPSPGPKRQECSAKASPLFEWKIRHPSFNNRHPCFHFVQSVGVWELGTAWTWLEPAFRNFLWLRETVGGQIVASINWYCIPCNVCVRKIVRLLELLYSFNNEKTSRVLTKQGISEYCGHSMLRTTVGRFEVPTISKSNRFLFVIRYLILTRLFRNPTTMIMLCALL